MCINMYASTRGMHVCLWLCACKQLWEHIQVVLQRSEQSCVCVCVCVWKRRSHTSPLATISISPDIRYIHVYVA